MCTCHLLRGYVFGQATRLSHHCGWVVIIALLILQPVNSSDPCRGPCGRGSFCDEFLGICEGCKSFCDDDPANCPQRCTDYFELLVDTQPDTTASPSPTQAVAATAHDSQLQPELTTAGDVVVEVLPHRSDAIAGGGDGGGSGDGGGGGSGGWGDGDMWWLSIPVIVPLVVAVVVAVVHRQRLRNILTTTRRWTRPGQPNGDMEMANIHANQTAKLVSKTHVPKNNPKVPVQASMQDDGRIVHHLIYEAEAEVKCQIGHVGMEHESRV